MRTKLLHPHNENCCGSRNVRAGTWGTPWHNTRQIEYRDAIGRKCRGGRPWLVLTCNAPGSEPCPAMLFVNETDFLESLPSHVAPTASTGARSKE